MEIIKVWIKRLLVVGGVGILLILVMDLNSRMVHLMQLRGEKNNEQMKLSELLNEENDLIRKIDYAQSEEALSDWARQENWMQKSGDGIVVPLPDGSDAEEVNFNPIETAYTYDNWDTWLQWLTYKE